jgi:hypothetical protein
MVYLSAQNKQMVDRIGFPEDFFHTSFSFDSPKKDCDNAALIRHHLAL